MMEIVRISVEKKMAGINRDREDSGALLVFRKSLFVFPLQSSPIQQQRTLSEVIYNKNYDIGLLFLTFVRNQRVLKPEGGFLSPLLRAQILTKSNRRLLLLHFKAWYSKFLYIHTSVHSPKVTLYLLQRRSLSQNLFWSLVFRSNMAPQAAVVSHCVLTSADPSLSTFSS
jgi:hypothetical protein